MAVNYAFKWGAGMFAFMELQGDVTSFGAAYLELGCFRGSLGNTFVAETVSYLTGPILLVSVVFVASFARAVLAQSARAVVEPNHHAGAANDNSETPSAEAKAVEDGDESLPAMQRPLTWREAMGLPEVWSRAATSSIGVATMVLYLLQVAYTPPMTPHFLSVPRRVCPFCFSQRCPNALRWCFPGMHAPGIVPPCYTSS